MAGITVFMKHTFMYSILFPTLALLTFSACKTNSDGNGATSEDLPKIYLWQTSSSYVLGSSSFTRTSVDQACSNSTTASTSCTTRTLAIISISSSDQISDFATLYSVSGGAVYNRDGSTLIASSWSALLQGAAESTLAGAGVTYSTGTAKLYATGSGSDGSYVPTGSCSGWTSTSGYTALGDGTVMSNHWLDETTGQCSGSYRLLCMCW